MLEFAPDAMVGVDPRGRIVSADARMEALFGHRRVNLIGQAIEILLPASSREAHPWQAAGFFGKPGARPVGVARAFEPDYTTKPGGEGTGPGHAFGGPAPSEAERPAHA